MGAPVDGLAWIHSFDRFDGRKGIKPGLERMEAMLERLGNPHHQLKFLHVAGTNGKGSTCAYLAAVLEEAGYRVGLYTSPYLVEFHDRMSVGGRNISSDALDDLIARVRPVVEEVALTPCGQPTEFEIVTVLALLHYEAERVDFVVWETGLGGRLDSTNVVTPLLSLITNVGRDHEAILGDTLEQIAFEKAGIIKPGVPVLTTAEQPALAVLEQTAQEKASPCFAGGRDFTAVRTSFGMDGQVFDWQGFDREFNNLRIGMLGEHQIRNGALAVAALVQLQAMGVAIPEDALRRGLARTNWAGRLEIVSREPLILLDGAHNPEGANVLAAALRELLPERRKIFVIGIMADKAIPDVLAPTLGLADHVIVTRPDLPRAAEPADVVEMIRNLTPDLAAEAIPDVSSALLRAAQLASEPDDAIVCFGSLYAISEMRAHLVG